MARTKLTPLSAVVDDVWGKKGTPERDRMELQLKEELHSYFLGEAIKKARKTQHLTQEQLGEMIGVNGHRSRAWKKERVLSLFQR